MLQENRTIICSIGKCIGKQRDCQGSGYKTNIMREKGYHTCRFTTGKHWKSGRKGLSEVWKCDKFLPIE